MFAYPRFRVWGYATTRRWQFSSELRVTFGFGSVGEVFVLGLGSIDVSHDIKLNMKTSIVYALT